VAHQRAPRWQPMRALPRIASLIRGMLRHTEKPYQILQQAKDRPYVLDDVLVAHVIRVYTQP
jgi:hypothetical protein